MLLAKDPWQSFLLYIDAETFDSRLWVTSKSLPFQLLHLNYDVSAYQPASQCLYFSVLNLMSQFHFFICIHTLLHIRKNKEILNSNKKIYSVLQLQLYVT
jgi:hypothetical protein